MSEVRASPTVSRVARRSFHATTQEGRAYLQGRIALFARVMLLLLGGYGAFLLVAYFIWGNLHIGHPLLAAGIGVAAFGVIVCFWLVARGKTRSQLRLNVIDVGCVLDPSLLVALNVFMLRDMRITPFAGFVGVSFLVFGRALIVPSTAQRTAAISAAASLLLIGATSAIALLDPQSCILPPKLTVAFITVWSIGTTILASYGSAVIYGLREKVREARQLGQYTLLEKVGEGGMGSVYRARHSMLRRPTAIKLLPPSKAGEQQLGRFEREVQRTAELTHPNTIHIYDYGRSPDGVFYYAMEYLDGIDLNTLVDTFGAQPAKRVIHIMQQVCGALTEAHDSGLVHRDIKPANIFLCHRGGVADVVKVLDFGLVKELDREGAGLTDVNVVAGTPAFLSPEAITSPDKVSPAADLYALGAVAYFLLTGEHVFGGATVVEVCGHHVHTAPTPPSERVGNQLDGGLEALILECLAKEPQERIDSARALKRRLDSLAAAGSWTSDDADAWWAAEGERVPAASVKDESGIGFAPTMEVDLGARAAGGS